MIATIVTIAAAAGFSSPAWAQGGVYVAGQGFTLEQAVEQALKERSGDAPFWIVAAGDEADRVTSQGGADTEQLLEQVRANGGIVYACEPELAGHHSPREVRAAQADLPTNVGLIGSSGPSEAAVIPPEDGGEEVLPESVRQNRLISRTCASIK